MAVADADRVAHVEVGEAVGEALPGDLGERDGAARGGGDAPRELFALGIVEEEAVLLRDLGELRAGKGEWVSVGE
jgi:hypothetical protein